VASETVYLFLVVSVPAAYFALLSLGEERRSRSGLGRALQGAAVAIPSLLVPVILRAVLPSTYRAFPHYLELTAVDHLGLHAAVTAAWIAIRGYGTLENEAGRRRWDDFFAFASGFYTLVAVGFALGHWGEPHMYAALLLPVLRLVMLLSSSLLIVVYFESYGIFRVGYAAAYLALPFAAGAATYLERVHYTVAAVAATVALAALASFAWARKERF
jgi:hypothetical protein